MQGNWTKSAIPLAVLAGVWLAPAPAGLADAAWSYFAIFAAVIAALILQPIPASAAGLMGVCLAAVTGYVYPDSGESVKWATRISSSRASWYCIPRST